MACTTCPASFWVTASPFNTTAVWPFPYNKCLMWDYRHCWWSDKDCFLSCKVQAEVVWQKFGSQTEFEPEPSELNHGSGSVQVQFGHNSPWFKLKSGGSPRNKKNLNAWAYNGQGGTSNIIVGSHKQHTKHLGVCICQKWASRNLSNHMTCYV